MKRLIDAMLRYAIGLMAIASLAVWGFSAFEATLTYMHYPYAVSIGRPGFEVMHLSTVMGYVPPPTFKLFPPSGPWFHSPTFVSFTGADVVFIPHWVFSTALCSAAVFLWLKAPRFPEGLCQSCGYDLTGNASGHCPECNSETCSRF